MDRFENRAIADAAQVPPPDGPVTRRSLLAWLGRATVVGLFSPFVEACVRQGYRSSHGDSGGLPDAGFDAFDASPRDPGGDRGEDAADAGADAADGEPGTDAATADDSPPGESTADGTVEPCDPSFQPGAGTDPVFQNWGERTVDRQDLAGLLATWRLTIDGLVDHPVTLDFCQLRDLGMVDQVTDFHCVEGWDILDVPWNGVPLSRLLDLAGVQAEARYLKFVSVGNLYSESLPLSVAREPKTLLALGIGGSTMPLKHGFPARIVVPRLFGYKNPKYVARIEATTTEHVGFWPRAGYTVAGEVPASRLRDGKY